MSAKMMNCRKCGAPVSELAERCPGCGDETAKRMGHVRGKGFDPVRAVAWILLGLLAVWLISVAL
jgi:predicted amidophosphoribosyltransferase